MNITILDDYANMVRGFPCFAKLDGHHFDIWNDHVTDDDLLAERLSDTEALVLLRERTPISAALIERLPKLKLITQNGPYPHIDIEACTRQGILVCAGHARKSDATAELTWGLILCAMRSIPQEMARLKAGGWQQTVGTGLRGRTLGLYGFGQIGSQLAQFGKAFGMNVLVWARERGLAAAARSGFATASTAMALFESSDVLSLHIRLSAETRAIIGARELARMKPDALLVNTSRAGIIAPGALEQALRAGRPGRAAVDVYETEPVPPDHPLISMENVICTPHLGYMERDQMSSYYDAQFERILAFARGEFRDAVNPGALANRDHNEGTGRFRPQQRSES